MDIAELRRLYVTCVASARGDQRSARNKFRWAVTRDPQAIFVLSDDETKAVIADSGFERFERENSPKGDGRAVAAEPRIAAMRGVPSQNNSPSLDNPSSPILGQQSRASDGETHSASGTKVEPPHVGQNRCVPDAEPKPSGGASKLASQTDQAVGAPPARPQPEGARIARFEVRQQRAVSIFESVKMHDGTSIGDVPWEDLPRYANAGFRQAWLCRAIYKRGVPANPRTPARELVSEADLERFQQKSAEMADAA